MKNRKGVIVVVSGPSGAGKGSICQKYIEKNPDTYLSISATTRSPRPGEVDGVNYYFYKQSQFEDMIEQNQLLEWASFCGNYYGTPKESVEQALKSGRDVILEIDVQGAASVRAFYPDGVYVFVLPPTIEVLHNRLIGRGTETREIIKKRISSARRELEQIYSYNYILINDDLTTCVDTFSTLIRAEKQKIERNIDYIKEEWMNDLSVNWEISRED